MRVNDEWVSKAKEIEKGTTSRTTALTKLRLEIEENALEVMPLISQQIAELLLRAAIMGTVSRKKQEPLPTDPGACQIEKDRRNALKIRERKIKALDFAAKSFEKEDFEVLAKRSITLTKGFGPGETLNDHGFGASDLIPKLFHDDGKK